MNAEQFAEAVNKTILDAQNAGLDIDEIVSELEEAITDLVGIDPSESTMIPPRKDGARFAP